MLGNWQSARDNRDFWYFAVIRKSLVSLELSLPAMPLNILAPDIWSHCGCSEFCKYTMNRINATMDSTNYEFLICVDMSGILNH